MIPAACDISIMAVLVSSISDFVGRIIPYFANTDFPAGPVTLINSMLPPIPSTRASTVPSPPSARGFMTTSASKSTFFIPFSIASPA